MTPLGHTSISYLVSHTSKKISVWAIILGGLLPDIDYISILTPWFYQIHRVVTHNLLFIGLAAIVGCLLVTKHRRMIFISLLLGGVLHLLADTCFGSSPSNGKGVAILWPFDSDYYFSPFNLAKSRDIVIERSALLSSLRAMIQNIPWEIPFYLGSIVLLLKRKYFRKHEPRS